MSNQHKPTSRVVVWLRAAVAAGVLLVATGAGGLLFGAKQKLAAIDCLSGASQPSRWEYERHGSEKFRSLLGERGTMMFLDHPRELVFFDVFTDDQARALHDLPTLRRLSISYASPEHLGRLHGLTHLDRLTIGAEVPPERIAELHASMPNCDIIYWYWDGSENREIRLAAQ